MVKGEITDGRGEIGGRIESMDMGAIGEIGPIGEIGVIGVIGEIGSIGEIGGNGEIPTESSKIRK